MDISKIPAGRNPPKDVNVLIEIPAGGLPVKYEMDKASGALFVDRFLHTAMFYPGNYGFIPHTLSEDGDPIDVLAIWAVPVIPGAVVRCRPVGVLVMQDQAGPDEKIVAMPTDDLHPFHMGALLQRPARNPAAADRPLLPALQGSGTQEMDPHRRLGRRGRGGKTDQRRDCESEGVGAETLENPGKVGNLCKTLPFRPSPR
jgi:inorganic pyrophosphatase